MVVGFVHHYSRHFVKKLGTFLESFFGKVQKTAKNGNKWPKMPILAKSAIFRKKADL